MKSFKTFLAEATTTVYHGDDYSTTKIDVSRMDTGNNQVGIGVYFGTLETAKTYGKNIISIDINPKNFKDGFKSIDEITNMKSIINLLTFIEKGDKGFKRIHEDFGTESVDELAYMLGASEARNFQIEVSEYSSTKIFVAAWNKTMKNIHGLFEKQTGFYSVINTNYKVKKL
jgi:hypothetical protein